MGTSVAVQESTRNRLEQVKRELGQPSLDATLTRLLDEHQGNHQLVASARLLQAAVRKRTELAAFAKKNGIRSVKVFGSAIHGDARSDSDLDLLVELKPGSKIGLIGFAGLENKISDLLGVKVDLRTAQDLSQYFRKEVMAEALDLHVEA